MTPEVRAFEYALGLFSVLVGLAVVDLVTSFHRLLRARHAVRWDPLAVLVALYALCMAVYMWFDIWGVRNFAMTRHFLFYLALVGELCLLFLIAAASLPDEVQEGCDLKAHYAATRRYLWLLISLFQGVYTAFGFYFVGALLARMPGAAAAFLVVQMVAPFIIALALLAARSRTVHYAGVLLLFAVMLLHYLPMSIS